MTLKTYTVTPFSRVTVKCGCICHTGNRPAGSCDTGHVYWWTIKNQGRACDMQIGMAGEHGSLTGA